MKFKRISDIAPKVGTTALALCLAAGNVAAASHCASPEEMTALKVAALRQQLMVAALTCHQANSFNRFVISYRAELTNSDHALMRFFVRHDRARADDAYNAYKTRLANDYSMSSHSDPWFCGRAEESLRAALERNLPLERLVADTGRPNDTGFESCMADDSIAPVVPAAAPEFPSRHRDTLESTPVNAVPSVNSTGALSPTPEREASLPPKPPVVAAPPPAEAQAPSTDEQVASTSDGTDSDAGMYAYNQPNPYQAPAYAYGPYAPRWWYGAPQPMQQVQGPDGRWYLVPAGGR